MLVLDEPLATGRPYPVHDPPRTAQMLINWACP